MGKASGPNGFPAEFYKHFFGLLSDSMLKLFNKSHSSPCAEGSLNIAKAGRDLTLFSKHRPVSVHSDVKILAKVLVIRLGKVWTLSQTQIKSIRGNDSDDL